MLYLTNIDHHNVLGLGKDVLFGGDFNADSFWVLKPEKGQMKALTLRVPYSLGFHRVTPPDGLTTRRRAGKAAGSGRAIRCTRRGIRKGARARGRRS